MFGKATAPSTNVFDRASISPWLEMGAYEELWSRPGASFVSLAKRFASEPGSVPSNFVSKSRAKQTASSVKRGFEAADIRQFGVCVAGTAAYPEKLRDASAPVALLYYQGLWSLVEWPAVAVVGSRHPSDKGLARTRRLVRALVKDGFTIVSGLAAGIDRMAHETALTEGGRTIAVIGTPLSRSYPRENASLQARIARDNLVISQVPLKRYEAKDWRWNRSFFPERNKTMSALSMATIIVEAGESSGTLVQARAAIQQGRKLFILDNCFQNSQLTWPAKFAAKGAIRTRDYEDVRNRLPIPIHED